MEWHASQRSLMKKTKTELVTIILRKDDIEAQLVKQNNEYKDCILKLQLELDELKVLLTNHQ